MHNILAFPKLARPTRQGTCAALVSRFASNRQLETDVFWLKENAEILGILAATDQKLLESTLAPFDNFYQGIEAKIEFLPQYYRFLISICLDLEDLGMPGDKGQRICDWAAQSALAEAELSDLQRAEARRLLSRRGAAKPVGDGALGDRLRHFIERSETFAMPNRKAAYELTHIVFYLSDYGRHDPALGASALLSLEFAGVLAYLDQNMDLLAEVCLALLYAGCDPSPIWVKAVLTCHDGIAITDVLRDPYDAYHEYLVTGWATSVFAQRGFQNSVPSGRPFFMLPQRPPSALMPLSACLNDLGATRSADWGQMRGHVLSYLGQEGHDVLLDAEQSTNKFYEFFEGFARASRV